MIFQGQWCRFPSRPTMNYKHTHTSLNTQGHFVSGERLPPSSFKRFKRHCIHNENAPWVHQNTPTHGFTAFLLLLGHFFSCHIRLLIKRSWMCCTCTSRFIFLKKSPLCPSHSDKMVPLLLRSEHQSFSRGGYALLSWYAGRKKKKRKSSATQNIMKRKIKSKDFLFLPTI